MDEVLDIVRSRAGSGVTEVHIVGGVHPDHDLCYYAEMIRRIREIMPGEGYLLDETVYEVGAEAGNFTIEHNMIPVNVGEDVIKGKIALLKHMNDGSTQIETPEEGAVFEVYLKSAGSYEAAEESERDILVCDAFGYAESKSLVD